jgi:hypothetical protein
MSDDQAIADSGCFMKRRLDQSSGMSASNFSEQHTDVQNTATMQACPRHLNILIDYFVKHC